MDKVFSLRNKPTCLSKKIVASSGLFAIEQLELEFSNGAKRQYERLLNRTYGGVLIIPLLDSDTLLLVKEYAAGTDRYELGFPKGLIDKGETSLEAANRELKEEVGFGAHTLKHLKSLSSSPAYFGLMLDLIVAQDLYPEKLEGDEPEEIAVIKWPLTKIDELLERNDFSEARSVAAIYLLKQFLKK